jgi:hypothetical protein
MHVCMYVRMYVCVYFCKSVCMNVLYVCMFVCTCFPLKISFVCKSAQVALQPLREAPAHWCPPCYRTWDDQDGGAGCLATITGRSCNGDGWARVSAAGCCCANERAPLTALCVPVGQVGRRPLCWPRVQLPRWRLWQVRSPVRLSAQALGIGPPRPRLPWPLAPPRPSPPNGLPSRPGRAWNPDATGDWCPSLTPGPGANFFWALFFTTSSLEICEIL